MPPKGKIIILSGPSGSGKTTLYKKLLKETKSLIKSISMTTRSPRPGEVNGKDYIFVTPQQFLRKIKEDQFLEHQKVFNNYYGTPSQNVQSLVDQGKNVLLCIDVKGAKVVNKKIPEAIRIFIKTPTWADLKARLMKRGTDDPKSLQIRLKTAKAELKEAKNYDFIIVNDDLQSAFRDLKRTIKDCLKT